MPLLTCSHGRAAWRLQRQQSGRWTVEVGAMKGMLKGDQGAGAGVRSWEDNRSDGDECLVEEGPRGIRVEAGSKGTLRPLTTNASVLQGALPTEEGGQEVESSWAANRLGRDCRERARRVAGD
jgi:hypothetical protein